MWRCDNEGCLGRHVTCHLFSFLVYFFKITFLLYSSARDVFPRKDVPFGERLNTAAYFRGQIPKKSILGRE